MMKQRVFAALLACTLATPALAQTRLPTIDPSTYDET